MNGLNRKTCFEIAFLGKDPSRKRLNQRADVYLTQMARFISRMVLLIWSPTNTLVMNEHSLISLRDEKRYVINIFICISDEMVNPIARPVYLEIWVISSMCLCPFHRLWALFVGLLRIIKKLIFCLSCSLQALPQFFGLLSFLFIWVPALLLHVHRLVHSSLQGYSGAKIIIFPDFLLWQVLSQFIHSPCISNSCFSFHRAIVFLVCHPCLEEGQGIF